MRKWFLKLNCSNNPSIFVVIEVLWSTGRDEMKFEYLHNLSEEKKRKITISLFLNPKVIHDLSEAAEDNELIEEEEENMRIVHEAQNGRK